MDLYVAIYGKKESAIEEQTKHLNVIGTFKFDHGDGEDWKRQVLQNFEALQLLEVMYGDHCSSTFTKGDLRKSLLRHKHTLEQSAAVKLALEIQEDKQSRDYAWLIHKMIAQPGRIRQPSSQAGITRQRQEGICYSKLRARRSGGGKSDKQTRGEAQSKNLTFSGDAQVPTCMYCYGLEKMSVAHNHSTSKCRNRREYAQALADQTEVINQRQADFIKVQRGAMQKSSSR